MGHTTAQRTIAAAIACAALLLTSAGACGPTGEDGGSAPGVSDEQGGDDDGDDDGGDDEGADDDGDGG